MAMPWVKGVMAPLVISGLPEWMPYPPITIATPKRTEPSNAFFFIFPRLFPRDKRTLEQPKWHKVGVLGK
jgi:hypothetical protein